MFYLQISVVVVVALICFFFLLYFFLYFWLRFALRTPNVLLRQKHSSNCQDDSGEMTNERTKRHELRTNTNEATRTSPTKAGLILRCRCCRRRRLHNCCCARSLTPSFSHSALRVTSRGARAPQVCPYHGERKHRVTLIRVEWVPCIFLFSD